MKMMEMTDTIIKDHYGHLASKPFFPEIVTYMTMSPIVALIVAGDNSIETLRTMCGPTNPLQAAPGTIRGDLALTIRYNVIHASDSPESATAEIARFFSASEVYSYEKITDKVV
jgi:nucleoside-diphosphate kinase